LRVRIDDEDLAPLHEGTLATVRATSLAGVANRYLALAPGPNNAPEIPDGGVIDAERTQSSVDLDVILNTLDMETRAAASRLIRRSAEQYDGVEEQANRGLAALNPALSQTAGTLRELMRDERSLERAIVESAAVVGAVEPRTAELEEGIANAAGALSAVAGERAALADTLDRAPATLRRANTTLLNLRGALTDLQPALREARPVAPRLASALRLLEPAARHARPAVADVRRLVPDLKVALDRLPATERSAVPAFASATSALEKALPIVSGLRPYVPDVVAGLMNGFGGTTGGYYDANGHYVRISLHGNPYSINNAGALVPAPAADGTLTEYRSGIVARCPGAAAQPAPDRSNRWTPPEASCEPKHSP
jgi:phospholipid/cholesterol/gamma-HCH transport system substrate-binding protein